MKKMDIVHGSENPFRDIGLADADSLLIKADLAVSILKVLKKRGWSQREAAWHMGIDGADVCRIRNGDLKRYSIEFLINAVNRLERRVSVSVRPARSGTGEQQVSV